MRIGIVLALITLVVLPAQAAYLVELTTGERLTVQSYWRDGEDVHLMRGGVDIIVKSSRIKSLESGVAEPEMKAESASATGVPVRTRKTGRVASPASDDGDRDKTDADVPEGELVSDAGN